MFILVCILVAVLIFNKEDSNKNAERDLKTEKVAQKDVSQKKELTMKDFEMDKKAVERLNKEVENLKNDKEYQNSIKPKEYKDIVSITSSDVKFSKSFNDVLIYHKDVENYNKGLIKKIKSSKVNDKGSFKGNLNEYNKLLSKKYDCGGIVQGAEYVICMKTVLSTIQNLGDVDSTIIEHVKKEEDNVFKNIKERSDVIDNMDKYSSSNLEKKLVLVLRTIINLEYNTVSFTHSVLDDFDKKELDDSYIEGKNEEIKNKYFEDNERMYKVYTELKNKIR